MNVAQQNEAAERLRGKCVLVVEDEYLLADDLARAFGKIGIDIAGPVPTLSRATELMEQKHVDAAVLDINLAGELIYPVADELMARDVPVLFVTGYDAGAIPSRFADVVRCEKPVSTDRVLGALGRLFA